LTTSVLLWSPPVRIATSKMPVIVSAIVEAL